MAVDYNYKLKMDFSQQMNMHCMCCVPGNLGICTISRLRSIFCGFHSLSWLTQWQLKVTDESFPTSRSLDRNDLDLTSD